MLSGTSSPFWGTWIEIELYHMNITGKAMSSPFWGTWIEIRPYSATVLDDYGRPPSGGRGLKCMNRS